MRWSKLLENQVVLVVLSLLLLPIIGTVGYMLVEGWGWFDALYMSIITITTIGYEEVQPLSPAGRWFTMVFVFLGVGVGFYALTTLAQTLLQSRRFLQKTAIRKVKKFSQHYIICGAGRVGKRVATELSRIGKPYVLIEKEESVVGELLREGFIVIFGDATQEEALLQAQILKADALVAVLPHDSDNVFTVLTARGLHPSLHIVARAETAQAERQLIRAGASAVVSPQEIGATRLTYLLLRRSLVDIFTLATRRIALDVQVAEIGIDEHHPFVGQTLQELQLTQKYQVIVLAVKSPDDTISFPPDSRRPLLSGTVLIIAGTAERLQRLYEEMHHKVGAS